MKMLRQTHVEFSADGTLRCGIGDRMPQTLGGLNPADNGLLGPSGRFGRGLAVRHAAFQFGNLGDVAPVLVRPDDINEIRGGGHLPMVSYAVALSITVTDAVSPPGDVKSRQTGLIKGDEESNF